MAKKDKKHKQPIQAIQMEQLVQDTAYALNAFSSSGTDELLNLLGLSRQQVYSAVMSDDEVDSCREDIVSALLSSNWRLFGAETDDTQMDKLYQCVRRNLPSIAEQVVVAKLCGYAVARLVYAQDEDGFISLKQVISRHDELDKYTPKFGKLIYNGQNGEEETETTYTHLFLNNKATSKNPAGEMAMVRIYPAVMLRKEGWRYAYQFAQRYAQPMLITKTDGDKNEAARKTHTVKNGGAAAIGIEEEMKLLQNTADGAFFRQLEQMANARIQKSILGRVKTSELQTGSRSAQQVESESEKNRIGAYLLLLADAVQKVVDALMDLNAVYYQPIKVKGALWFEYETEIKPDTNRAERDKKYLESGNLELTEQYYTDILGFEPEHFKIKQNQDGAKADTTLSLNLSGNQNDFRQPESQLSADQQIMQPKIHAILSALASSENFNEFNEKLNNLDLSVGDQILIDKLVWQNSQAWLDGAGSLKGSQ